MGENMYSIKERFNNRIERFLSDKTICAKNRKLFAEYFKEQAYKLKRINNLRELDLNCYRTLYVYIVRINNINKWFKNKPFVDLTKKDIQKVYDDLEDGIITKVDGKPYESLSDTYYNKIFKSTLFKMAGKLEIAKEIIKYVPQQQRDVRFYPLHVLLYFLHKAQKGSCVLYKSISHKTYISL